MSLVSTVLGTKEADESDKIDRKVMCGPLRAQDSASETRSRDLYLRREGAFFFPPLTQSTHLSQTPGPPHSRKLSAPLTDWGERGVYVCVRGNVLLVLDLKCSAEAWGTTILYYRVAH